MFYVTVLYVNEYSSNIEVPVNDSNTINQLFSDAVCVPTQGNYE